MARLNPNRRLLVTAFNTALATAAVTATAAGWVAFGMSDTNSATAAAQPEQPAFQQQPAAQQPFSSGRHRGHRDGFGFGSNDDAGQSQQPFDGGSGESALGQSQSPPSANDASGSSGQSQPSLGGSQFRRPLTSTRSSR